MVIDERFLKEFSEGGFPICNKHEEIEYIADLIRTKIDEVDANEIIELAEHIMDIVLVCRNDAINMENRLTKYKLDKQQP